MVNRWRKRTVGALAAGFLVLAVAGLLLYLQGPRKATTGDSPGADSHARMIRKLKLVRDQRAKEYGQLGEAEFNHALDEWNSLGDKAPANDRCRILVNLGNLALQLGDVQRSVQYFQQAVDLKPSLDAELKQLPSWLSDSQRRKAEFDLEDYYRRLDFLFGVAWLRTGEVQNCVHCQTGASCILPIATAGVHTRQVGSRNAIPYFLNVLDKQPDHLGSRWLLNITYMTLGEYPDGVPERWLIPPSAFTSKEEFPRFPNLAADAGLNIVSLSGGAIADDFDDDGYLDIFMSTIHPGGQLRYLHNDGNGHFSDQSLQAGLEGEFGGLNIVHADYDNDGRLDLLVLRGAWRSPRSPHHPHSLLRNLGGGRFRDVTFDVGLGHIYRPSQTASWSDFDNDGDLDLYIGNENFPSQLFENDGQGHFRDIAAAAGVENNRFAKGVVWGDYDNDRLPDLYVSNLGQSNRLYKNLGNGQFKDMAEVLGVEQPLDGFPAWFWDFDNDGVLDLFAAAYNVELDPTVQYYLGQQQPTEFSRLYRGDGRGGFRDVTLDQNLKAPAPVMGANFGDLDNDGYPDFYLGTGYPDYQALMPNVMYHNHRGKDFGDVTFAGGFGHLQKGHGVSFADLDNDGDQDVFIELGGAFLGDSYGKALFENPGFGNHWIKVKLAGRRSNRCGIGARIRADIEEGGGERSVYKWVNSGGSFGGNPLRQEIGLGSATQVKRLEIYWPASNLIQEFHNVPADQLIEVTEGESEFRTVSLSSTP